MHLVYLLAEVYASNLRGPPTVPARGNSSALDMKKLADGSALTPEDKQAPVEF
jgi:hypothetical protein